MASFDDAAPVVPDGLTIRRRRRRLGLSRRAFVHRVATKREEASGDAATLTRNILQGVEEANERIPYGTLCLIALVLDCNPVELLAPEAPVQRVPPGPLH